MQLIIKRSMFSYLVIVSILLMPISTFAKDLWSSMRLPVPKRIADRQYLGISEGDTFSPAQVNANVIVVQIFSMYCPICQREAPNVNDLFKLLSKRGEKAAKIKFFAIGAGNSDFEVDFYRTTYGASYPLFGDGDYIIHRMTGEVGTPYFYILKRNEKGVLQEVYTKAGPFESAEKFYQLILQKAQ